MGGKLVTTSYNISIVYIYYSHSCILWWERDKHLESKKDTLIKKKKNRKKEWRKRKNCQTSISSYKPGMDKARSKLIVPPPPPFDEETIQLLSLVVGFSFWLVIGLRDKERDSVWSPSSASFLWSRYSSMQDLEFCKEHILMLASISLALCPSVGVHSVPVWPCTCHEQNYRSDD